MATSLTPTSEPGSVPLRYRRHQGQVLFGAESYFFQEGQGHVFQSARYGQLKVDQKGMPILVGLTGEDLQSIKP